MNKELLKNYPIIKTKTEGVEKRFNLSDPQERKEYFEQKAGSEIKKLKEYLGSNTFIAYLLGKKNSGKGTYTKLMIEIFGNDKIRHISVGDIVRSVHSDIANEKKKKELIEYLGKNYRGYISIDEAIDNLLNRNTQSLLPTEFILALIKREIDRSPKKSLFIDGFPRELDQVSYSLYFRDLINYRDDDDIFVAIDIPESVIDERMKYRVVCPKCHTPRSLKLLVTKKVGYDKNKKEFYLICDDEKCGNSRMVAKEGDNLGIETIRERLGIDDKLIEKTFSLHGVPKILLRNSISVDIAKEYADDYELTPEYTYELDSNNNVRVIEKPWTIKNDEGVKSHSLLAPPVVVSLIKQLSKILS